MISWWSDLSFWRDRDTTPQQWQSKMKKLNFNYYDIVFVIKSYINFYPLICVELTLSAICTRWTLSESAQWMLSARLCPWELKSPHTSTIWSNKIHMPIKMTLFYSCLEINFAVVKTLLRRLMSTWKNGSRSYLRLKSEMSHSFHSFRLSSQPFRAN